MCLVDGLSAKIFTISGESLYGGAAFMIKILIKSLSNAFDLFIPFTGNEIINESWIISILVPRPSSTFEVLNERLFLMVRRL